MTRGRPFAAGVVAVLVAVLALVAVPSDANGRHRGPRPVVAGVGSGTGPTTGGTEVTIRGRHLRGATKVTFGGRAGTEVRAVNARRITVVTPAHVPGTVPIRVKTSGGWSARRGGAHFTFRLEAPQVAELSPATGPDTGGTVVTVAGTGFTPASAVSFGGTPGTAVRVLSPTRLQVTAPELLPGGYAVVVAGPTGASNGTSRFRSLAAPVALAAPLPADADPGADVSLPAVVCPAVRTCFAAGGYSAGSVGKPLVERRTGRTSWEPSSPPLPAGASGAAYLLDVDCASPTFCVAVGAYSDDSLSLPFVEQWDGAGWTPRAVGLPSGTEAGGGSLNDVDCPAVGVCVAIGSHTLANGYADGLVAQLAGDTWSARSAPVPSDGAETGGASLAVLDCPTPMFCAAAGQVAPNRYLGRQDPLVVTLDHGALAARIGDRLDGNTLTSLRVHAISCTSPGYCVVVGDWSRSLDSIATVLTVRPDSLTTVGLPANGNAHLDDVACVAAATCVAAGYDYDYPDGSPPYLATVADATATPVEHGPLPADARTPPDGQGGATVCPALGPCSVVGTYQALSGTRTAVWTAGGSWTSSPGPAVSASDRIIAAAGDGQALVAVADPYAAAVPTLIVDLPR